jgi:hypothetical protein
MFAIRTALAALTLSVLLPALSYAGQYSSYSYSPSKGYGYRTYSYVSKVHKKVHHHIAVYHKHHPRKVYMYNVQTKKYWGRFDLDTRQYSLLAEKDKKGTIAEIPESAFPPGGEMPPEELGGDQMLPPPEMPQPEVVPPAAPQARYAPTVPMIPVPSQPAYTSCRSGGCHK